MLTSDSFIKIKPRKGGGYRGVCDGDLPRLIFSWESGWPKNRFCIGRRGGGSMAFIMHYLYIKFCPVVIFDVNSIILQHPSAPLCGPSHFKAFCIQRYMADIDDLPVLSFEAFWFWMIKARLISSSPTSYPPSLRFRILSTPTAEEEMARIASKGRRRAFRHLHILEAYFSVRGWLVKELLTSHNWRLIFRNFI